MKKKFELSKLKIKSFVTSIESGEEQTLKGGTKVKSIGLTKWESQCPCDFNTHQATACICPTQFVTCGEPEPTDVTCPVDNNPVG